MGLFTAGVRSRSITESNFQSLAFGGYTLDIATGSGPYNYGVISLFNDNPTGDPLTVVCANIMSSGGIAVCMDLFQGTFGSFGTQGRYAYDPRVNAPGQLWQTTLQNANSTDPGPTFPGIQSFATGGFTPAVIANLTMFTLPGGYSFRFANDVTFAGLSIGLWWLVGKVY